jgi:hypothetical protein
LNNANMQNCIWKSFMYFYIFVPSSSSWKKKKPNGVKRSKDVTLSVEGFLFSFGGFGLVWFILFQLFLVFFTHINLLYKSARTILCELCVNYVLLLRFLYKKVFLIFFQKCFECIDLTM